MYMQTVVHNYVVEHSVHGLWSVKNGDRTWKLKLTQVVDDSTEHVGDRQYVATGLLHTETKPVHHLEIDFIVDFSMTPWTVSKYIIHEVDGKEVNPHPEPPPDPDDAVPVPPGPPAPPAPPGPNGRAAGASSKG